MKKKQITLPKIIKGIRDFKTIENFPLKHYSYSTFVKFSTNPIMFRIKYINGDNIDSASKPAGVTGKAFHHAMEIYYDKKDENESEAIKAGLTSGLEYLEEYGDHFIDYNDVVKNKQKMLEIFSFTFNSYLKSKKDDNYEIVAIEECIEETVDIEWRGARLKLPVPLKGYIDKLVRSKTDGKLRAIDYKTTRSFSDPDKIDGAKILQAVQYYFMVYAKYGEPLHSLIFEEVKTSLNSGPNKGQPQLKEYEIVFEENDLFFDFYFRFYEDMTRAINGEAVFVPNINDFYDNEVAIISYIYRLDEPEEQAKQMKLLQVTNITDLLKKKIETAGSMRKLLKTAEKAFVSAKSLNYNKMKTEEKIQTKLMEHGMLLKFESKLEGNTVDLYQFNPSIGLKMSKLKGYVSDIEQVVGVAGVRVLAPIPNTTLVGFEVPRKERTFISLDDYPTKEGMELNIGVDILGNVFTFDVREAPHILIAGATGSGKSVFLNSLIHQLSKEKEVELHLFDPKRVELSQFRSVAKEYYVGNDEIYLAIAELVEIMEARYRAISRENVRNIEEFNKTGTIMKYKVVVIDEFGDLTIGMESRESKEFSKNILLLAQKARACGIHLIIATQRPSVDIITGTIKANFVTKVAFRMAKETDSRVLLDEAGAEKLLGKGDMIFSSDNGTIRLQGFSF